MTLKKHTTGLGIAIAIAVTLLISGQASAQSTIFNIPSTDVVAKGKKYFEFDYFSNFKDQPNGGFYGYTPRIVVGVGKGLEVGANLSAFDSAGPTTVYIQPNFKWQFYAKEESGISTTVGATLFTPIKNHDTNDTFGLFYWNMSKKFKGAYGPRITVGAYGLGEFETQGVDRAGAIVGYEQPVTKKISFVADWFSGDNGLGYATPGISIALPKSSLLNVGYSIGNFGRNKNGLFVYYGKTF